MLSVAETEMFRAGADELGHILFARLAQLEKAGAVPIFGLGVNRGIPHAGFGGDDGGVLWDDGAVGEGYFAEGEAAHRDFIWG